MSHANLEALGLFLGWLGLFLAAASLWVTFQLRKA